VKTLLRTLLKTCVNVVVEAFVKAFVKTQMSTFLKTRALYTREPAGTMQQEALARRELDRRWLMILVSLVKVVASTTDVSDVGMNDGRI
jgi:hypothetical protein